jgi:hypothetical protein
MVDLGAEGVRGDNKRVSRPEGWKKYRCEYVLIEACQEKPDEEGGKG